VLFAIGALAQRGGGRQARALAAAEGFEGVGQVVDEVPAVGALGRVGRPVPRPLGVGAGAVPQIREQAHRIGRLEERLAGQLASDRDLTDLLAESLQRERDAALRDMAHLREEVAALPVSRDAATRALAAVYERSSEGGTQPSYPENAAPGASDDARLGAARGHSAAEVDKPTPETSNGNAPQNAVRRVSRRFRGRA